MEAAARAAGISGNTLRGWIATGRIQPPAEGKLWTAAQIAEIKAQDKWAKPSKAFVDGEIGTIKQAASSAGLCEKTLHRWIDGGLVDKPANGIWTTQDIERIRAVKRRPFKEPPPGGFTMRAAVYARVSTAIRGHRSGTN